MSLYANPNKTFAVVQVSPRKWAVMVAEWTNKNKKTENVIPVYRFKDECRFKTEIEASSVAHYLTERQKGVRPTDINL